MVLGILQLELASDRRGQYEVAARSHAERWGAGRFLGQHDLTPIGAKGMYRNIDAVAQVAVTAEQTLNNSVTVLHASLPLAREPGLNVLWCPAQTPTLEYH